MHPPVPTDGLWPPDAPPPRQPRQPRRVRHIQPTWVCLLCLVCLGLVALLPRPALAQPAAPEAQITPPELVTFVPAEYPPDALAAGQQASVLLRLQIAATGAVDTAEVVESAGPAFDRAALVAVKQFTFRPALINTVPTPVRILYRYQFTLAVEAPTTATLEGVVRTRGTAAPLGGLTIAVQDGPTTTTDADGRFVLEGLSPGVVRLTVSGPGLTPIQTEETLEAGQRLAATYEIEPPTAVMEGEGDDLEVVVRAPALRRETVTTVVAAEEARRLPGTQGDVLKVVESMPGVARSTAGSGQLVVWGAAPSETRVVLDGIPLPRLYHEGGVRSVVGSELISSVDLIPGAYGAAYGRGLGGVVRVESIDLAQDDDLHLVASADVFDAGLAARGRLADGVHLGGTLRLGYLDRLVDRVVDPEDRGLVPAPRSTDGQVRLKLSEGDQTLEALVLHASDLTQRSVGGADPGRTIRERKEADFQRFGLRWQANQAGGARLTVTPWAGHETQAEAAAVGPVATSLQRRAWTGGVRVGWLGRLSEPLSLEAGLDLELSFADLQRRGALTLPAREGDARVFGQPPPDQIAADAWSVSQLGVAPHLTLDWAPLGDVLHIEPGLRLDPTVRRVSRRDPPEGDTPAIGLDRHDLVMEPRLALRWQPLAAWRLVAGAGLYHQPPADTDLSAVSGNPKLPPSQARHLLLGTVLTPVEGLSAEITTFGRWSDQLAVRNTAADPPRAQALVAEGEGRALGAQILLRGTLGQDLLGWISYSLIQSERRDAGGDWRPADQDQTHVFAALASWSLGAGFELGSRVRLSTGFPTTAVEGAWFDSTRDRWQPTFGVVNGERLPAFFQWDLRASRRFDLGSSQLDVWLEVQNVTDRENVETWVYAPDFSRRTGLVGLPVLPFLGLRWTL